jgi:Domain of Unknown Function (DUF1080)
MPLEIFVWVIMLIGLVDESMRGFEKEELERPPQGFTFSPSNEAARKQWQVAQDGDNRVLARLMNAKDEHEISLAIQTTLEVENLILDVRVKAVSGERDKNAGLVWRYQDSKNYLLARLDVSDKRVRLYRVVNGNRVKFGEEDDLRLKADTWYTLRVEHRDDKIKVYLDGDAIIVERDKHFQKAGRVGLYANEDAKTYFDDFHVRPLDDEK